MRYAMLAAVAALGLLVTAASPAEAATTVASGGGDCSEKPWVSELVCRGGDAAWDTYFFVWELYCDLVC